MNDLFSQNFGARLPKGPYVDLQIDNRDFEGQAETEMSSQNMKPFFNQVDAIKDDMQKVRNLLSSLQNANMESSTLTAASAVKRLRDRMDKDVEEVLKKVKKIKADLEDLDRANLESRRLPGCGKGSSTDRTRMSVTNSLRNTLKDLMNEFQVLREKMMHDYRQTIERRYYTITGKHADEHVIDEMIDTGESETFLQRAIQEQGRGQIIDTIKEIQERHESVKEIERNLMELHQIFLDMSVLVEAQGEQLNNIEIAVQGAASFVDRGAGDLQAAKKLQRNTRKCKCIVIIILLVVLIVLLVPILVKMLPSSSSNGNNASNSNNNTTSASRNNFNGTAVSPSPSPTLTPNIP
ncbi:hypothetical protein KP509_10G023900 [Ceratopteris richardii]|uniref:t-SNARE coiled-coil homology domain-containing protein n=1 Tax=Ceratopteris richardii TaxID=49495 RepID=A0A8T2TXH2_CERRI|nr:hypothetical protein KP509_10G023900 [Ceratopteris richardii]